MHKPQELKPNFEAFLSAPSPRGIFKHPTFDRSKHFSKDGIYHEDLRYPRSAHAVGKAFDFYLSGKDEGRKDDGEKRRMDLIPVSALNALADVLTMGAKKYSDRNWEKGISWGRVYGAAMRHLSAWWGGENLDKESGLNHLDHAMTNIAFLREYADTKKDFDDRPNTPFQLSPITRKILDDIGRPDEDEKIYINPGRYGGNA